MSQQSSPRTAIWRKTKQNRTFFAQTYPKSNCCKAPMLRRKRLLGKRTKTQMKGHFDAGAAELRIRQKSDWRPGKHKEPGPQAIREHHGRGTKVGYACHWQQLQLCR